MKNANDTGANERGENRNGTGSGANSVKWKKQLVSGAVYIALAVTVVAVTVSTITATLSGDKTDDGGYRGYPSDTLYGADYGLKLPEIKDFTFDTPVSDVKQGVDATVTDGEKGKEQPEKKDDAAVPSVPERSDGADKKETSAEDAAFFGIGKKDEPDTANGEEQPKDSPNEPNGNGSAEQNDKSVPRSEEPTESVFELGYDGYIKPCTGYISKEYSVDMPVYSATMYDYRTHAGIDIACEAGTPVRAVTNGVIDEVYNDYLLGTTVVVKHSDGITSVYSNLSPDLPAETTVGRSVITGEVLGGIGNSALCESAEVNHLHFEMKKDGKSIDPGDYLPKD